MTTFTLPLSHLEKFTHDLAGAEIGLYAEVYDWNFMENKTQKAHTIILSHEPQIKFIGGRVRTFKPGQPLDVYVSEARWSALRLSD